jgi:hypothetical protein
MTRVSSAPGASTALTWVASPGNFVYSDINQLFHPPNNTPPGNITIQGLMTITGNISYCSNPNSAPVPNVTLNVTGDTTTSTLSDASGNYQFLSLWTNGNYTVTPTKSALAVGSAGITTVDIVATQRHFLNVVPLGTATKAWSPLFH